jgi:hypothetical protein
MKIATLRQFRDQASRMFRSKDPILITRRGRLAGVFLPSLSETLPLEIKRDLFVQLTAAIARQLKSRGLTEDDVLEDFEAWRKTHSREARR